MNSETSEVKQKRVRNPETKTVASPLGPNLFMYAESFLAGNCSVFIVLERNYSYRGSDSTG